MIINKKWAMPNKKTFSIKPIKELVTRHIKGLEIVIDPFARSSKLASITNDLDPDFEIGFRINWTQISAVSDGTTWVLRVGVDKKDAVMLAEDAAGIAVLDTVIAEKDAGGAALKNLWTSRGIKDDIGLTRAEIEDGGIIRMSLEAEVVDTGQDEVIMLGLEIDYSPQRCIGEGSNIDSSLISTAST